MSGDFDGMDQDKTNIPQFKTTEKISNDQLHVRLIGGLLYFKEIQPFGFFF